MCYNTAILVIRFEIWLSVTLALCLQYLKVFIQDNILKLCFLIYNLMCKNMLETALPALRKL